MKQQSPFADHHVFLLFLVRLLVSYPTLQHIIGFNCAIEATNWSVPNYIQKFQTRWKNSTFKGKYSVNIIQIVNNYRPTAQSMAILRKFPM